MQKMHATDQEYFEFKPLLGYEDENVYDEMKEREIEKGIDKPVILKDPTEASDTFVSADLGTGTADFQIVSADTDTQSPASVTQGRSFASLAKSIKDNASAKSISKGIYHSVLSPYAHSIKGIYSSLPELINRHEYFDIDIPEDDDQIVLNDRIVQAPSLEDVE